MTLRSSVLPLLLLAILVPLYGAQDTTALPTLYWQQVRALDQVGADQPRLQQRAIEPTLRRLARSRDSDERALAILLGSALAAATGQDLERPRQAVQDLAAQMGEGDPDWQLMLADGHRRLRDFSAATTLLDAIGRERQDLRRVLAAEGLADVFLDTRRLDQSLDWIRYALAGLRVIDRYNEEQAIRARLEGKRRQIEAWHEIVTHGLGLHLYTLARRQQLRQRPEEALLHYDRLLERARRNAKHDAAALIADFLAGPDSDPELLQRLPIDPVYSEAARLYRAQCLLDLARYDQARRDLQDFLRAEPLGLYRGEALALLIRIALEGQGDPNAAVRLSSQLLEWVPKARAVDAQLDALQVPEQSRRRTAPPPTMRQHDDWGNLDWSSPGPASVVNRLTTPWYLDRLLWDAHTHRAISLFLLRRGAEAQADLEAALRYDPHDQQLVAINWLSNFGRLRDGFRTNRLHASTEELELFPMRVRVPLVRAEMLFETEQWVAAVQAYRMLRQRFGQRLSRDALAYLDLAEAAAILYQGKREEGAAILMPAFGVERPLYPPSTPSFPRAMRALASARAKKDDPVDWLKRGLATARNAEDRADFLLSIGQWHYTRMTPAEDQKAREVFEYLVRHLPHDNFRNRASRSYLVGLAERQ